MAKVKISEYSVTNSDNTDINSINISEGCAPSGINNAIREVMVHLKNWQTNASGDGATFASLVVQGTGSFTGAVTMSAGSTLSGTNTLSGANIISGNINSSGSANTFSGGVVHSGTNTFSSSVIISGNINSSGTTNTFSGGNILSGTNTLSGSTVMAASLGTSASPSIYFTSDTNTGIFSPTADTVGVSTGGSERVRIDSQGRVGIGGSPNQGYNSAFILQTGVDTNATTSGVMIRGTTGYLSFDGGYNAYGLGRITWVYNNGSDYLTLSTTATERMRIDSSGNLLVGKTSATANGGVLQVSNGITFPATQSACSDANTLDDYEQGTWTPVIDSATAGTGRATQVFSAKYTKIGNLVTVHCYIKMSTLGTGGSGIWVVTGLPFTSLSDSTNNYNVLSVPYSTTLNSNLVSINAYVAPNSTTIRVTGQAAAGPTFDTLTFSTYVKTGTDLIIGGSYFTAD